jgi:uncharacterized membrane protein
MQGSLSVVELVYLAFVINIPCGYLRENYKKFSPMWWILIHISIPIIIALRIIAGISWHAIPLTLGGSVAGQIVGGIINRRRNQNGKTG